MRNLDINIVFGQLEEGIRKRAFDLKHREPPKLPKLVLKSETVANLSIEFTEEEIRNSSFLKHELGDGLGTAWRDDWINALLAYRNRN